MGVWDNLKDRLKMGGNARPNGRYDEYDEYGDYDPDYDEAYPIEVDPDRAATPLVSMYDIRSQRLPLNDNNDPARDRIKQGAVYPRGQRPADNGEEAEMLRSSLLYKQDNSLVNLHHERLSYESQGSTESLHVPQFNMPGEASIETDYRTRAISTVAIPRGKRQLVRLKPLNYAEIEAVAPALRKGDAVVLDLTAVRPELAKRLLDFAFGVTSAFAGTVDRHEDRIYVLTTRSPLTDVEKAQL